MKPGEHILTPENAPALLIPVKKVTVVTLRASARAFVHYDLLPDGTWGG